MEAGASAEPLEVQGEEQASSEGGSCLRSCGICCGGICIALVAIGLLVPIGCSTGLAAGSLSFLGAARPPLTGSYDIGSLRGRLPAGGSRRCGVYVQVTYPRDTAGDAFEGQSFPSWRDAVVDRSSKIGGLPQCLLSAVLGGQRQMDPPGAPLANSEGGWPVVVFSSGLFGALEVYQQFCRDIASTGVIVVAIEHEDGSGQYATDCDDNVIEYIVPPAAEDFNFTWTNSTPMAEWRRPFLERRVAEYEASMEVLLEAIDFTGEAMSPIAKVLQTGRSDRVSLAGHSFGGCSAWFFSQHLRLLGAATPFIGVAYLDIWAEPLLQDELEAESREPFIHIVSEGWAARPALRRHAELHPATTLALGETLGTLHQWIAETQYLMPYWIGRPFGALGSADVPAIFGATMEAVRDSLQAFADPSLRASLNATVLSIYPEGLVPF